MGNIAVDLHGVLTDDPNEFKQMMTDLKAKGHKIYVMSGPPKIEVEAELEELGYTEKHFDYVLSVVDYLKEQKVNMWQDEKLEWWADSSAWWPSKGQMCELYHIDVIFDNSIEYKEFMPDFTAFMFVQDKETPELLGVKSS